ncbi:hypothetical protein [Pleionea sp. CnH1-48]|uniref:glycine-rich domain-containing protein n=1 Tax=Pleionea sp. CnH1-48 TaxID=2954494 RepID=UPI00209815DC|nr:hypothetical protein [Pleionea sp. CnH1-48]MCO7226333.1 hypothetical protein [Pleionea sp. CnH1-48]
MPSQVSLWQRLEDFSIGSQEAQLSFARRLARENNWSLSFSEKAILEYKKFIYLVAVTGRSQTPSDAVDQVWHLHLCYTQSYWNELCEEVVGKAIHHNPTEGGTAEDSKFEQQYQATLDDYEKEFGAAPRDVWPDVTSRFKNAGRFVRVNTAESWLVSKTKVFTGTLILPFALLLSACSVEGGEGYQDLLFWLKAIAIAWVLFIVIRWLSKHLGPPGSGGSGGGGGDGCGSGCSSGCGGGCGS